MNQQQQSHHIRTDNSVNHGRWGGGGGKGSNTFYWRQVFVIDTAVVKTKILFSSHGGFPSLCNVSSQRNNLIKLTHYDETKKMAHDSKIVRATENVKFDHVGPSQRQSSGANQLVKALHQGRYSVLTHHCAIKEETIAINRAMGI